MKTFIMNITLKNRSGWFRQSVSFLCLLSTNNYNYLDCNYCKIRIQMCVIVCEKERLQRNDRANVCVLFIWTWTVQQWEKPLSRFYLCVHTTMNHRIDLITSRLRLYTWKTIDHIILAYILTVKLIATITKIVWQ